MVTRTLHGFLFLAAATALLPSAFAQPPVEASMAAPPPPPVRVTGKVVLEDKSVPPAPALIQRLCGGLTHPEGTTDLKGNFAVDLGHDIIVDPYAIHIQPGIDMPANEGDHPFNDCLIEASLPGYRSDLVPMAGAKPDGHPYLGIITLHYVGKVDGYLISPTTLEAPKDAKKSFDKAQEVTRKNKQSEAIDNYQKAVKAYPNYAQAWFELGRLQASAKNMDAAKESFNSAIKADPKFLSPYLQLSALAYNNQDWPALADISEKLLALDAFDYPQSYYYAAVSDYFTAKYPEAEKRGRESLKADTEHHFPETYELLASILVKEKQPAAAVEQLETYLKLFPSATDTVTVQSQIKQLKDSLPAAKK
jgi:cytochrome c-type biogenesis protein CcmH/NrfG